MFAVKCVVIYLFMSCIRSEDVQISQPVPAANYKKLIEVKTNGNSIVNGRNPIIGVFEDYNSRINEPHIDFLGINMMLMDYGIEEIEPGAFQNVGGNIDLILSRNNLKTIKKGIFNNVKEVLVIDLSNNKISYIADEAFDNIPDLINIRLTNNALTKWNSNWFVNTPKLTSVWFQNNFIKELPAYAFKSMRGSKSRIFGITLMFDNNRIKTIDLTAFKGIHVLDNLRLANNSITKFPATLLEGVIVNEIDLSGNDLLCIPKSSAFNENSRILPSLCEK